MVGVRVIVGVKVIVGISVLVAVEVGVAAGTCVGEGEGDGDLVMVAVTIVVGVLLGELNKLTTLPQPAIMNDKRENKKNKDILFDRAFICINHTLENSEGLLYAKIRKGFSWERSKSYQLSSKDWLTISFQNIVLTKAWQQYPKYVIFGIKRIVKTI